MRASMIPVLVTSGPEAGNLGEPTHGLCAQRRRVSSDGRLAGLFGTRCSSVEGRDHFTERAGQFRKRYRHEPAPYRGS